MAYDENYYKQREQKLSQKQTANVQRLVNAAIEFVRDSDDLSVDLRELQQRKGESKPTVDKKEDLSGEKPMKKEEKPKK